MNSLLSGNLMRLRFPERFKWLAFIGKLEYAPLEECRSVQKKLLFDALERAVRNVPYYRQAASRSSIVFSPKNALEVLPEFPVLTKKILRERFGDLKAENFRGEYSRKTSGGSTGEPAVFLQDGNHRTKNAASEYLFYRWAGREPGESMVKLWGSEEYIRNTRSGVKGWMRENLLNATILNSYRMSAESMLHYVKVINRKKPAVIEGYVESLYELARFADERGLNLHSPRGVIATAGTLYPEVREVIEKLFNCAVFNRYGSREAGDMACSCEEKGGLHLNIFNHYVEILDGELRPCRPGEPGGVYVTTLHNRIMPLVRYKIGDVAVPAENEKCLCGRGMPLIREVRGRETEHFISGSGDMVYGGYFRKLLYGIEWVKQYRIVQEDYGRIVFYFTVEPGFEPVCGSMKKIEEGARRVMGKGCAVEFRFVREIFPSRSGKYLYTECRAGEKG